MMVCKSGHIEIAKLLLEREEIDFNVKNVESFNMMSFLIIL